MPRASGRRSQLEEEWWGGGREEVLVGWGLMILVARTGNLFYVCLVPYPKLGPTLAKQEWTNDGWDVSYDSGQRRGYQRINNWASLPELLLALRQSSLVRPVSVNLQRWRGQTRYSSLETSQGKMGEKRAGVVLSPGESTPFWVWESWYSHSPHTSSVHKAGHPPPQNKLSKC